MSIEKNLILRQIYYSPKLGYRSAESLYELASREDDSITRRDVKDWLKTQASYTKFKRFLHPRHFRLTYVRDLGEQIQVDLLTFMQKYHSENDGYKYIAVAIEILSRYVFAVPLRKRDGPSTKLALQQILTSFHARYHKYPKLLQFDEGPEFLNKDVKPLLSSHDIHYFSTVSKQKAAVVERFNRTLKTKILKMFVKIRNPIMIFVLLEHF